MSDEPKKGLDLAKLLSKKTSTQETPATTVPPAEPQPSPPVPTSPVPKAGDPLNVLFGGPAKQAPASAAKAVSKAPTQSKAAPPSKPTPPAASPPPTAKPFAKPSPPPTSQANTPFNASIEDASSRSGAQALKLDVTVAQDRKYPRGFFGIDEIFVHYDILYDVVRRHLWRLRADHKQRFTIGYRVVGSSFFSVTLRWNGADKSLVETLDTLPEEATVAVTHDADAIIDQLRGRVSCNRMFASNQPKMEGDKSLLYWLAINLQQIYSRDMYDTLLEEELAVKKQRVEALNTAADPIEAVTRMFEQHAYKVAESISEPLFLRLRFAGAPRTDVLLHFQDRKTTTLRGQPGEDLPAGAVDFHIDEQAIRAIAEGEANLYFMLLARRIQVTGDIQLLKEARFVDHEQSLALINLVHHTQKPLGIDNRIPGKLHLTPPARDPYLDLY